MRWRGNGGAVYTADERVFRSGLRSEGESWFSCKAPYVAGKGSGISVGLDEGENNLGEGLQTLVRTQQIFISLDPELVSYLFIVPLTK